jgi:hypothetical protein
VLTEGEHEFRAETKQAILVGEYESAYLARADPREELLRAALVLVQSGADIGYHLIGPPLGRTEALQQRYLTDEIVFLAVGGYPRIGNRCTGRRCLVSAKLSQLG